MSSKTKVHFTHNYLLQPTNPITVNIIGAGGTGSQVLAAMARTNESLIALGHPGLHVHLFDNDRLKPENKGRLLFTDSEQGLNKAVAFINRINRACGTNWKAITQQFSKKNMSKLPQGGAANIIISCVDTVPARFEVADIIRTAAIKNKSGIFRPFYWMDFGNSKDSGQVILSTVGEIQQPPSKKFEVNSHLPFITEEFNSLLEESGNRDSTPSCSIAEALANQDLFINPSLAYMGSSLLWNLLREGMILYRGFFLNLKNFRSQPIPV